MAADNTVPDTVEGIVAELASAEPRHKLSLLDALCSTHAPDPESPVPCDRSLLLALRLLAVDPIKTLRAAAYRTLRYFAREPATVEAMWELRLHCLMVRSMEQDASHEVERIQAFKLLRRIIDVDAQLVPRSICASLVSLSRHAEDPFCRVSLETLCDMCVRCPQTVALAGGVKALTQAILDPKFEDIVEPITLTLMHIFNSGPSRVYMSHGTDMGIILAPFTNSYTGGDKDIERKREAAGRALLAALRTWPGMICFASLPGVGIGSLVGALNLEDSAIQLSVLDTLFQLFRLRVPRATSSFQQALKRHSETLVGRGSELSRQRKDCFSLLDSYLAALLLAFVRGGMVEVLVDLGMCENKELSVRVTILLGEILHLANSLLPHTQCAQLQTLPSLVAGAAAFIKQDDPRLRSRANTLLSNLHEFARVKKLASEYYDFHMALLLMNTYKTRRREGTDNTGTSLNDHMKNLKVKMEARMDDKQFDELLKASQVLSGKDYTRWHWDLIAEVIEGPLSDVRRMEECITRTKFAKRILSFLRPSNHQFSDMRVDKRNKHKNLRYIRTACILLESLTASDEGARYLAENELLDQITEFCRHEIEHGSGDPGAGVPASSRRTSGATESGGSFSGLQGSFLDKQRLAKTMTCEYFTMLGVLSSSKRGQELLESKEVFNVLYPLMEGNNGREDLSKLIVTSLDYNLNGHPRVLLAKAMTCKNRQVRYIATRHMRVLMRARVSGFNDWGTDLLVTQLGDADKDISSTALKILVESCEDEDTLSALVSKRPTITSLEGKGRDILLRFMATPQGFSYLQEHDWIQSQMDHWAQKGVIDYVNTVEVALARSLQPFLFASSQTSNDPQDDPNATALPPHFFGELARTQVGSQLLQASNHFAQFVAQMTNETMHVVYRKAALWTVGHIGSSDAGFQFVAESDVLAQIVSIAQTSSILSLRGTAYFALGLISMCEGAAGALKELGWEANGVKGICVPFDADTFFQVPPYTNCGLWADSQLNDPTLQLDISLPSDTMPTHEDDTPEQLKDRIVDAVGKLSNHLTTDAASRELKKLKRDKETAPLFNDPALWVKAIQILNTYSFRRVARKFIMDLFDSVPLNTPEALATIDGCPSLRAVTLSPAAPIS